MCTDRDRFLLKEEVHHATAYQEPKLDHMYGPIPRWADLSDGSGQEYKGKHYKFLKAHLDFDKIFDYAWCELERKTSQRCMLFKDHGLLNLLNGGIILSWNCCGRKENGRGLVHIADAPLAILDPVQDAVCSCAYPRCFNGQRVSQYKITSAKGELITLKRLVEHGIVNYDVNFPGLFPALEKKLRDCCAIKTEAFIGYARRACGEQRLKTLCSTVVVPQPRQAKKGFLLFPKPSDLQCHTSTVTVSGQPAEPRIRLNGL